MKRFMVSAMIGLVLVFLLGAVKPGAVQSMILEIKRAFTGLPANSFAATGANAAPVAGEHYVWRPVAVGGGGFITGIAQDKTGQAKIIRTDVHGAYRWDSKLNRWVQMVHADHVPQAYRVQAGVNEGAYEIAVAPSDARRVYMAIKGQIWRSDDGGVNWRGPAPDMPYLHFEPNSEFRFNGSYMAVSPDNPDYLLAGTPTMGVWQSRDGGDRWARIASLPVSADLRPTIAGVQAPGGMIWFSPAGGGKEKRIRVAIAGRGLWEAKSGSSDFYPISGGPQTITQAAFLPDGSFMATDWETSSVWQLRGAKWRNLVREGILPVARYRSLALSPRTGQIIVVTDGGDMRCSLDKGANWSSVGRSIRAGDKDVPWMRVADQNFVPVAAVEFDAAVPEKLIIAQGQGVFVATIDAGCHRADWVSQSRGIEEIVTTDIVQAPGMAPLFAGFDFGIHLKPDLNAYSTTYGPRERVIIAAPQLDWTPARPGFLVTNASDTRACCAEDGDAVMAGYSIDGGRTWVKFPTLPTPPGTRGDDPWRMSFGTIAIAADAPDNIIWAPAYNRSPFYTLDRGASWHRVVLPGEKLPFTGSYGAIWTQRKTLAADRVKPGSFYLYHSGEGDNPGLAGLWGTEDGGRNWMKLYEGEIAPQSRYSAKLRVVPGKSGHLFFTTGVMGKGDTALRRSTDGGRTWQVIAGTANVDDVAFGKAAKGQAYPAIYISGRIDGRYGIWRSVDNTKSWQRLAGFPLGRLDQVTVIEADKDVFGRVYIGYMGSGWIYGEPGRCDAAIPISAGARLSECSGVARSAR